MFSVLALLILANGDDSLLNHADRSFTVALRAELGDQQKFRHIYNFAYLFSRCGRRLHASCS